MATTTIPTLLTVTQFAEKHPAFTPSALRWLLFNRTQNGLDKAVVRVGRRLLLDEDRFFGWVHEQNPAWQPRGRKRADGSE